MGNHLSGRLHRLVLHRGDMFEPWRRNIPVQRRLSAPRLFGGAPVATAAANAVAAPATLAASAPFPVLAPTPGSLPVAAPASSLLVPTVAVPIVEAQGQFGSFDGGLIHAASKNRVRLDEKKLTACSDLEPENEK